MKKIALCLALLGLLALGGQALAVICAIDEVPAATLFLPYFEVDLANPNGVTTLFSINNASATAVLAHVVVWSDLSVPVLDFNVYLTGYDVQSINMRDILAVPCRSPPRRARNPAHSAARRLTSRRTSPSRAARASCPSCRCPRAS